MSTTTNGYKVIGTRPIRHDGVDKVTGRAMYGADVQLAGLLHGRVLRSPHAHARIKAIDVSKAAGAARRRGGRHRAPTCPIPATASPSWAKGPINLRHLSSNCLARDKVLYKGQAVAAVAADQRRTSPRKRCKLIEVEYEPLPPVIDVRDGDAARRAAAARRPGHRVARQADRQAVQRRQALPVQDRRRRARASPQAAVVVEREFHTATVHQGYIEPHNATALWNADGTLTIWCSTQGAFTVRAQVAELLQHAGLAASRSCRWRSAAASAARSASTSNRSPPSCRKKTGKPVKVLMSRAEVFEGTGPTPGSYIKVKMGADNDGQAHRGRGVPGLRGRRLSRLAGRAGLRCASSPATTSPTSTIDGYDVVRQQAGDLGLPRPGRDQRRLRRRDGRRRDLREAQDRPARVPHQERRQGRHAPRRRPGLSRASA